MLATPAPRRQARSLRWLSPPWDQQHPDWLRLDRQLPAHHRVRLVDRFVEALDLQPLLPAFYAGFGSASWPPALLLKLVLYELDRKVRSPAQWHRDCQEHLPLLWLLRGAQPCRAALYDCRRRLSPSWLEQLNRQLLLLALSQQPDAARRASLDGTFIAARSSRHHLLNLQRLNKRLHLLEEAVAADQAGSGPARRPRWMARSVHGRLGQLARYLKARQRLEKKVAHHQQQQTRRAKSKRRPPERVVISPREPEAVVGKDKLKVVRPLYNVQLVSALDSALILAYAVFAATSDAGLLPEMLGRLRRLGGRVPEELLADGIYSSVQDLLACQAANVRLYAPVEAKSQEAAVEAGSAGSRRQELPLVSATEEKGKKPDKLYGKGKFIWDEASHSYTCPAGQTLQRVTQGTESRVNGESVEVEKFATKACADCAQRERCTTSKKGRQIKRLVEEPLVEALRQRMASESGRELYRLRKQTVERDFAEAKEHRGLRQFSGFGLELAETEVALLVLLNNGKAWLDMRPPVATPAA